MEIESKSAQRRVSLPIIKVKSIQVSKSSEKSSKVSSETVLPYHTELVITANKAGSNALSTESLQEGDRLFWPTAFEFEERHYPDLRRINPKKYQRTTDISVDTYICLSPIFTITGSRPVDTGTELSWKAQVPLTSNKTSEIPQGWPRLPFREEVFPVEVIPKRGKDEDGQPIGEKKYGSLEKNNFLNKVFVLPRTDFSNPDNSQYYVILNGTVKGKFIAGSAMLEEVENYHLLRIGDFVNQQHVPSGTRIRSIIPAQIKLTSSVYLDAQESKEIIFLNGKCKGLLVHGADTITEVECIHFLKESPPEGWNLQNLGLETIISSGIEVSKIVDAQVKLTQKATQSTTDHVPCIYVVDHS